MPTQNPYRHLAEGPFMRSGMAEGWQTGYDAAISSPSEVPPHPLVRDPDFMDGWEEGAAAGHADGQAEGWRLRLAEDGKGLVPGKPDWEPQASGETGATADIRRAWGAVGWVPLAAMLSSFAPDARGVHFLSGMALGRVCVDRQVARVYLPACSSAFREKAGHSTDEPGYWFGTARESFDEASAEAHAHANSRLVHLVGVVRFQPVGAHNFWDWLPFYES
ncbi:hypothetical protein AB0L04_28965 [Streptomyces glaucescens]|uniref:hypothetical protein n=1 Tax=Streptomyces glaucescens TaxID=1907 RepID=UPI00344C9B4E